MGSRGGWTRADWWWSVQQGDKVRMQPMWKYEVAVGEIEKITEGYVIVKWSDIPGQWHYTKEQAERLEILDESG